MSRIEKNVQHAQQTLIAEKSALQKEKEKLAAERQQFEQTKSAFSNKFLYKHRS